MIHFFFTDLFTTSLPLVFSLSSVQSMKYLRFSRSFQQRCRVLLLLILFMFCHFVRLSALSFSSSLTLPGLITFTTSQRANARCRGAVGECLSFLGGNRETFARFNFFSVFFVLLAAWKPSSLRPIVAGHSGDVPLPRRTRTTRRPFRADRSG